MRIKRIERLWGGISPRLLSLLGLALLSGLSGCQQTELVFTPTAEPSLPEFTRLAQAPEVAPVILASSVELEQIALTAHLQWHRFAANASGLNGLRLVALSPDRPYANVDVLRQAFELWRIERLADTELPCANTLFLQAGLHSLTLGLNCPAGPVVSEEALALLLSFWQQEALQGVDPAEVRRQLKLAKHIEAFSGSEIERLWMQRVLGETHPYNQALNDKALADSLDGAALQRVHQQARAQSRWTLLSSGEGAVDPQRLAAYRTRLQPLLAASALDGPAGGLGAPALTQGGEADDVPTILLLDAPGSVQTQVRIGYGLGQGDLGAPAATVESCQILASWLGRGFSGRLFYDLREVRGLTYGIYGRCFDNPLSTTLKFYGSTRLEHTGAFVAGVLDHLALARNEPIGDAELAALRQYERSALRLQQSTPAGRQQWHIQRLLQGERPPWQQSLDTITPAQLSQRARAVLAPAPWVILRGDADKIVPDLQEKLPDWRVQLTTID
ncbi:M16 family metallopeptidase [Ferrimonas pelagia]|uniref:Peptidase M16 C-terminal domain-containing protein n=1 Tax=Ferrimonas pelagia TaxID=1177826 RepID=A0ABP9FC74_9GAMM